MDTREMARVIAILKKETALFTVPAVTEVSRKRSPFEVLVSCIISLRTKDAVTREASRRLFSLARTPRGMLALSSRQIERAIYPAGFYRTKARTIKALCRVLLERHGGKVPDTEEELLALPGVGRKTCNIVLVYAYGRDALPIDTHCHRIPNRLGWVKTKRPEETEFALREILPRAYWQDFNDIFVTFGQNICTPVRPRCPACPVTRFCAYYRQLSAKKRN
jgi:endonuclease-3